MTAVLQLAQDVAAKATTWADVAMHLLEKPGFTEALVALMVAGAGALVAWRMKVQRDALIRGVEDAGDKATKEAIAERARQAGVDGGLAKVVSRMTERLKPKPPEEGA